MSYEIPDITYSDDYFVHQRNMGQKMSGSHMYPNVPWSDVVLQHVPIEVPMRLAHQDYLIGSLMGETGDIARTTIVGERHVDSDIRETENFIAKDRPYKANEYERVNGRMRKIPREKRRSFQVKPRNKDKDNRNKYFKFL
jgi:hypothetical protein